MGWKIDSISLPLIDGSIELGLLSIPFTVLVIVGITNALNMIDGMDGADGRDGARGSAGKDVNPNTIYDLRSGIAASLATAHAIRSDDGFRVGVGYYENEHALSIGGRSGTKTFTLTFDSQDTISAGFGFDL